MSGFDKRSHGTLVLGASGFLGPWVVASAVARARRGASFAEPLGEPVLALARRPERAPRFAQPRDAGEWVALDAEAEGALERLLDERRPRWIVNAAALARAADCAADPERARRTNVELPRRLATWCAESGTRLVQVSTDLVFGSADAPSGGFREEHEPGPLSVYGESKAEGERAVLATCPEALVVRLPLMYGNSGGRGSGASDALLEAVDRDERPRLFRDEWRTPLEVSHAAEALVELAEGDASGLLHVAGPQRVSRFELGLQVLRAMGLADEEARAAVREASSAERPELGPRPRDVSLDARRARALLETELPAPREGLRSALR